MRELADKESISINQFIVLALAEKLSALATEEYLGERARRGDNVQTKINNLLVISAQEPPAPSHLERRTWLD